MPPDPSAVEFDFEPEEVDFDELEAVEVVDMRNVAPGTETSLEGDDPRPSLLRPVVDAIEDFSLFEDLDTDHGPVTANVAALPHVEAEDLEPIEAGAVDADPLDEASDPTMEMPRPAPRPPEPPPSRTATAAAPPRAAAVTAPPLPPRRSAPSPLRGVPFAFLGAMCLTMVMALAPWFLLLSPRLHAVQTAQREATVPQVVEVPVPVVERVIVKEPAPAPSTEPEGTEVAEASAVRVDRAVSPPPSPRPLAKPQPAPAPVRRAPPPAPAPVDLPEEPEVEASEPEPEPQPAAEPAPKPEPEPEPEPVAPAEAKALSGRYGGTSRGEPILFDLDFLAEGRVRATIQRGSDPAVTTIGRYALAGDRATIAVVEPTDGGASYSATVTESEISGRINHPNGKNHRFSLDR